MSDIYDLRDLAEEMNKLREIVQSGDNTEEEDDRLEELEQLDAEFDYGKGGMEEYADNIDPIMIANYHFEYYARQLAEDIGAIDRDQGWPACHIDWEAAAENLKMDYTSVSFEGREYWIRG